MNRFGRCDTSDWVQFGERFVEWLVLEKKEEETTSQSFDVLVFVENLRLNGISKLQESEAKTVSTYKGFSWGILAIKIAFV